VCAVGVCACMCVCVCVCVGVCLIILLCTVRGAMQMHRYDTIQILTFATIVYDYRSAVEFGSIMFDLSFSSNC